MAALRGLRDRSRTVLDLLVVVLAAAALVSPWSISIAPAHLAETFGYESPACWLAVAGLAAVLVLDLRAAVVALIFVEAVLVVWFGWATWVITTPRFTILQFPFMATDLLGSSWYAAALGLLFAAGAVVRELWRRSTPPREDLWLLTAIPGFGLMRLGRWWGGVLWTGLFTTAFYLASIDSLDPIQFAEYGRYGEVPPPNPRGPEWVLLGLAALFWVVSVGVTVWRRRGLQTLPDSD